MWAVVRRALRRLRNVARWGSVQRDLEDEVAHHLALAAAEHERRGLSAAAAQRQAVREFGGERWVEASRGARGVPWLQDLARDTRYAVRSLGRSRGFAVAVVVVMALGVSATTSVYSVIRGVLLNPLPYADPGALYTVLESSEAGSLRLLSHPTFREVAAAADGVAGLAYVRGELLVVRGPDGTLNLPTAFVSANFLELMGRDARVGRTFGGEERSEPVAVLSARLAARVFGDARAALGRTLATQDGAFTVIGVMPAGFAYPSWAEMWVPLEALPGAHVYALEQRDLHVDSDVVLRVRPGVTPEQVAATLASPIARASAAYPGPGGHFDRAELTPLRDSVLGPDAPRFGLLAGAVALVLVLAIVNIAGLLLARGLARRGEMAARLALGAGRGRLVRQLVTEGLVLSVVGGAAGVLLAYAAVAQLRRAAPTVLPRLDEVALDGGVLLFACAVTLLSGLLFSAVPALRVTSGIAADAIRSSASALAGSGAAVRLRAGLVVAQIALAVVLLVGASLLVRTGQQLGRFDPGFSAAGVFVLQVNPPERYGDDGARLQLYERLRASLARVPGVERVALVNHVPPTLAGMPTATRTEREPDAGETPLAIYRAVSWDYLETIGARAARGRLFAAEDAREMGVVVNETLARREWGDADPIGRSITIDRVAQGAAGFGEPLPSHVIGVVRDLYEQGPGAPPQPTVYVPLERGVWTNVHLVVKTAGAQRASVAALRAAVEAVDPSIATSGPNQFAEFHALEERFAFMDRTRRLTTRLLASFALVAVVLALAGLSGVLAFVVVQRRREIGVRMALGARRRDAAGLVVRQSAGMVLAGLAIGVAASVPATRVLEASLFGVERLDAVSYALTCALFLATAALAAYLPARRAAGVDPAIALRGD